MASQFKNVFFEKDHSFSYNLDIKMSHQYANCPFETKATNNCMININKSDFFLLLRRTTTLHSTRTHPLHRRISKLFGTIQPSI